jgi:hypothetical protein
MAAPPGFNANASLLPDPGAASAPIHIVQGGGAANGGSSEYTIEEQHTLAKYGLDEDGPLAEFPPQTKRAFLDQIETACAQNAGQTAVMNSKCWAVVDVIRGLMNEAIRREVADEEGDEIIQTGGVQPSGKGIKNPSNCCYFISILQVLYSIPEFREFVEGYNGEDEILQSVKSVFQQIKTDEGKTHRAGSNPYIVLSGDDYEKITKCLQQDYKHKVNKAGRIRSRVEQQDALEFLSECILSKVEGLPVYSLLTPAYQDPFYPGLLGFPTNEPHDLQEKLNTLSKEQPQGILKPEQKYVFVAINRNAEAERDETPITINDTIEITNVDGLTVEFELKAFVFQAGELSIGHFYSFIKGDHGEWVEYNDSTVGEPSDDIEISKSTGVIYLYEKKEDENSNQNSISVESNRSNDTNTSNETNKNSNQTEENSVEAAYTLLGFEPGADPQNLQTQIEIFRQIYNDNEIEPYENAFKTIKEYLSQPKETRLRWLNIENPEAAKKKQQENTEALEKWGTSKYNPDAPEPAPTPEPAHQPPAEPIEATTQKIVNNISSWTAKAKNVLKPNTERTTRRRSAIQKALNTVQKATQSQSGGKRTKTHKRLR